MDPRLKAAEEQLEELILDKKKQDRKIFLHLFITIIMAMISLIIASYILASIPPYDRNPVGAMAGWFLTITIAPWILIIPVTNRLHNKPNAKNEKKAIKEGQENIILTIKSIEKEKTEEKKRIAQEAEEKTKLIKNLAKRQTYLAGYLVDLNKQTLKQASYLPQHLKNADNSLKKAKSLYEQSMFAPFWDTIEQALIYLGEYYNVLQTIKNNSIEFRETASEFEGEQIAFSFNNHAVDILNKVQIVQGGILTF